MAELENTKADDIFVMRWLENIKDITISLPLKVSELDYTITEYIADTLIWEIHKEIDLRIKDIKRSEWNKDLVDWLRALFDDTMKFYNDLELERAWTKLETLDRDKVIPKKYLDWLINLVKKKDELLAQVESWMFDEYVSAEEKNRVIDILTLKEVDVTYWDINW